MGQDRRDAVVLDDLDRRRKLLKGLSGQSRQKVGPDLAFFEPGLLQTVGCPLEFVGRHLLLPFRTPGCTGGLQSEPHSFESGPLHQARNGRGDPADVQGIGGVETYLRAVPDHAFEKRHRVVFGLHQQGIVVKHEVPYAEIAMPAADFIQDPFRAAGHAIGVQFFRRAVGTGERAALGGQQRDVTDAVLQIVRRVRIGVQVLRVKACGRPKSGDLCHHIEEHGIGGTADHPVGTGGAPGVLATERGVNTAENQRHIRKDVAQHTDGLLDARIPVGHHRGDQDHVGVGERLQIFPQPFGFDAVAGEAAGDVRQRRRFRQAGFQIWPATAASLRIGRRCAGMEAVQAVDVRDHAAVLPQQRGQHQ